ncbi:hypothetical protein ANN_00182 [Periplaneta americana]|uniref:Reverse transcriptase domain-containing protein n=1 Tax=Periplaneta americana TaxID=6978 RepID=A0ABQ8TRP9_PERAM|nr:hypothetical protein ANN_00182 [Periplaneta americana]
MKVNGSKSKSITFCKTREETSLNYEFSGVVIPQEQCCKYLGVYLNSKLAWGEHVDNVTGKAWKALHFIMRILRKASPKSREIAYLTLVRPLMEYGTTCWDPYRIYQINSLERIEYWAAKFVKDKREDGNDTIKELKWETLENIPRKTRITSLYRAHLGQKAWVDITARLEKPTYYGRNDHDFKIKCRKQKTDVDTMDMELEDEDVDVENMGRQIVGGRRIKCIRFGDDMALLAEVETILKDMLLELNDSCEQYGMKINANKTKTMVIGRKIKKENGGKLHNAELHALYCSPDIIRNIKSRRLRWAGHVACMGESRNAYRVLVGRPEGKRPLGRPRRRWEDNIKMDLREVGYDDRDWINLAQDRDRWRPYVRAAM